MASAIPNLVVYKKPAPGTAMQVFLPARVKDFEWSQAQLEYYWKGSVKTGQ